jgi:hypothetical protein
MQMWCWLFFVMILSLSLGSLPVDAHMTSMGSLFVRIDTLGGNFLVVLSVSRDDLGTYLQLDRDGDERVSEQELEGHRPMIAQYLAKRLTISNNNQICAVTEQRFLREHELRSKGRIVLMQRLSCPKPLKNIAIENTVLFEDVGGHKHIGRIEVNNEIHSTIFSLIAPSFSLQLASPSTETAPLNPTTDLPDHTAKQLFIAIGWLSLIFLLLYPRILRSSNQASRRSFLHILGILALLIAVLWITAILASLC